ncbi:hypothetical protein UVI_02011760 [Ustilaginoidea virens]|uniref:Uncharacterized protein n=1 Tax=Ustilaginoidea virens TaxID=1159556 RepID=A0A1B5L2Z2_USTVR|nr:hypothetical protein UVI_02011760 [Ustilaginoidea virens]
MERVLREVWHETKAPLMIYATEAALDAARTTLSAPLQRFVRADNKAFQQELNQEMVDTSENEIKPTTGLMEPMSPTKRKHRADSVDSMDSNRASIGSDDGRSGFDNPFEDSQTSSATMTATGTPAATAVADSTTMDRENDEMSVRRRRPVIEDAKPSTISTRLGNPGI